MTNQPYHWTELAFLTALVTGCLVTLIITIAEALKSIIREIRK